MRLANTFAVLTITIILIKKNQLQLHLSKGLGICLLSLFFFSGSNCIEV